MIITNIRKTVFRGKPPLGEKFNVKSSINRYFLFYYNITMEIIINPFESKKNIKKGTTRYLNELDYVVPKYPSTPLLLVHLIILVLQYHRDLQSLLTFDL